MAFSFVDGWDTMLPDGSGPQRLNQKETEAVKMLFQWASELALPSSAFAPAFDETIEVTESKNSGLLIAALQPSFGIH